MDSKTLRKKFLNFFEKNGHIIIPSAPLVPADEEQLEGKEKVLFTSAGMQQLIPYLMGKPHPKGNKLADVQKCVRTDDIEEVGDATHHTFFEMLGNWSLGDYWKDGAIELSFKFLTEELKIPLGKLAVSVFAGDKDAPRDEESSNKWKELGISEKRIVYLGKEANWWPTPRKDITTGELKDAFGLCGPDTEMFIWIGKGEVPEKFDPTDSKWVEVWNDVFMEFNRKEDGVLEELPQKNVDTGMGLERMLAVLNGKDNDYETDLFEPIIEEIKKSKNNYSEKSQRIIADHLRAAVFLVGDGVKPNSEDDRGSIVHHLIRDGVNQIEGQLEKERVEQIIKDVISVYSDSYKNLAEKSEEIIHEALNTVDSIRQGSESLELIKKETDKLLQIRTEITPISTASGVAGEMAFDFHQNFGTASPTLINIAKKLEFIIPDFEEGYQKAFQKHQQVSRWVPAGEFKGGLAEHNETTTKYHTATHLLHQALRDVLGPQVFQKGSNITSERLRFDFSFDRKMTDEEIKKTEEIINKRIDEDLKVDHMIIPIEKAKEMNAIGLFNDKYAKEVSIYGVGPGFDLDELAKDQRDRGGYYSLEFCGGPHVEHTGTIGKIKITREEAISAGIRRIRAQII